MIFVQTSSLFSSRSRVTIVIFLRPWSQHMLILVKPYHDLTDIKRHLIIMSNFSNRLLQYMLTFWNFISVLTNFFDKEVSRSTLILLTDTENIM